MRKGIKIKPSCLFCACMLITGWVTALYLKQTTTADIILIEIFFISFVGMSMPTCLGLRSSLNSQCLPKSWTNLIALAFGTGLYTRMHFHVEGMPVVLYLWCKLTWMLSMINEWQSKLHKGTGKSEPSWLGLILNFSDLLFAVEKCECCSKISDGRSISTMRL